MYSWCWLQANRNVLSWIWEKLGKLWIWFADSSLKIVDISCNIEVNRQSVNIYIVRIGIFDEMSINYKIDINEVFPHQKCVDI